MQKFSAFYRTRWCIAVFARVRHSSLLWTRTIRFMPYYPIFARSVFITFIMGLGVTSGPLLHVSPPKTLSVLLFPPIHATCLAYLTFLDLITGVRSTDYEALWSFFQSPLNSFHLRPKYFTRQSILERCQPRLFFYYFLRDLLDRQYIQGVCTRMNCKIVPITSSNRYVQYGASGKGVVEIQMWKMAVKKEQKKHYAFW